ncbi:MAG: hypothetical protein IIY12_01185 [Clostridia bacterium]|nr:hypothetical protein [Clostridia bacterium]MBQ1965530.1 hypothetical protein [Clostridia bacterium]MBQ5743341.1 hypothetical protein [Clostridia bacterium]
MKRLSLLLALFFTVCCITGCASSDRRNFEKLHTAFQDRGNNVEGYEVTAIEENDGFDYFCVRVCLNSDDALLLDDYMWFEADVMLFDTTEQADAAYQQNQQTGLGGTCLRRGNILIYWMAQDPFADLYREVIESQLGQ